MQVIRDEEDGNESWLLDMTIALFIASDPRLFALLNKSKTHSNCSFYF